MIHQILLLLGLLALPVPLAAPAAAVGAPLIDAHIHYSEDAWAMLPPADAVAVLRRAGLTRAFVSSSSDDGTQKLYEAAPDLVVPVLRPYRRRGETGTWLEDPTIIDHVEQRLAAHRYAGIGEFHVFGAGADMPVMRRVVELAKANDLFLHAHADADAVSRIYAQDPQARVLWAHSGFTGPEQVRAMLARHPTLMADLAFREDVARGGTVDPVWRQLFDDYPDRFMLGTDTYVPERWHYVIEHADWSRRWLASLPAPLAERIAWRNAEALARWPSRP